MTPLMPPDEALATVVAAARPLETVRLPLTVTARHVLAEPLIAKRAQPTADLSAMDGYALISEDCEGATETRPVQLHVVGTALAGRPWGGTLQAGQALRITTGALLPAGATAVVAQEHVTVAADGRLVVTRRLAPGENIRRAGEEYVPGEVLLTAGTMMGPAMIGLAAAAGFETLLVHRRPRVALLATGDELVDVAEAGARPECPVDANTPMLAAAVADHHAEVVLRAHAEDRVEAMARALETALATADVVVTTGGASVGPTDAVAEAWARCGIATTFWKVAMKPGKPVRFGQAPDGRLVFALPGNPLAALTAFELFVAPALARLGGLEAAPPAVVRVPLGATVGPGAFTRYLQGDVVGVGAAARFEAAPRQGSGMLRTVANHPVCAKVAPGAGGTWQGAPVEVALTNTGLAGQVLRPAAPARPMLAVTGPSGNGKTRLIEQLLYELTGRGLKAAVLKHATHRPEFDRAGKDSFRHASAGAWHNAVIGPGVVFARFSAGAAFDPFRWLELVADDVDVLLFEGFSEVPLPSVTVALAPGGRPISLEGPVMDGGRPTWRFTRPLGDGPLHFPRDLVAGLVDSWLGALLA
jgi:molybdopterin molybdotransferase